MALCHKWDVKNDFAYVLQFFSLIFDGLGSVGGFPSHLGTFVMLNKLDYSCLTFIKLAFGMLKSRPMPMNLRFLI